MKKFLLSALAALALAGFLAADTFKVDGSHSNVGFKVKHMMVSNVVGSFGSFSGTIDYNEKAQKLTGISGTVEAASIDTGDEKRDKHLRAPDFFDTEKYPAITFVMKKMKGDKVIGDLTMRGVTKEVALELEMGGVADDPWGNRRIGFTLEGKIDRREFGLEYNKVLEAGGLAVGHDVKLVVELEGMRKK